MGKVFITDEVNDTYTADVTSSGALKVIPHFVHTALLSAAAASGSITTSPCWLHSVVLTQQSAATATVFVLKNANSGGIVQATAGKIGTWAVGAVSGQSVAGTYLFDCYCANGLSYNLCAGDYNGITVTYRE